MNVQKHMLSFADTGYFSAIAVDFVAQHPRLQPFVQNFLHVDSLRQQIELKQQAYTVAESRQAKRSLVQNVMQQQYANLSVTEAVANNMLRLLNDNTFTICTAHQPCIFTGPLYFLYKITHAIALAKECQKQFSNYHFVPVFYIGSEDNDLEEIGQLFLNGEKLQWQTDQTGACGRMLTDDLLPLTTKIIRLLNEREEDEAWLKSLLEEAYGQNRTLSDATRIFVNGLFGEQGLLVLDGDDARLKQTFADLVEDELFHQRSSAIVEKATAVLSAHYPVQATGRELNLFYLKDNLRERILKKDDRWIVNNTKINFDEEQLRHELAHHPERFSPNVILRPLYQESLLPNIAFVGGGGEIAYWLELKSLFENYNLVYPLVMLRNSFLFIDQKNAQAMQALGIGPRELFLPLDELNRWLIKDHEYMLQLNVLLNQVNNQYDAIEVLGAKVSQPLLKSMQAHHARANRISKRIHEKFNAGIKQVDSVKINKAAKLKESLFPGNSLQERHDHFIPLYKSYGRKLFNLLTEQQQRFSSHFIIITED